MCDRLLSSTRAAGTLPQKNKTSDCEGLGNTQLGAPACMAAHGRLEKLCLCSRAPRPAVWEARASPLRPAPCVPESFFGRRGGSCRAWASAKRWRRSSRGAQHCRLESIRPGRFAGRGNLDILGTTGLRGILPGDGPWEAGSPSTNPKCGKHLSLRQPATWNSNLAFSHATAMLPV